MSKKLEAFNKLVNSRKYDRTTNSYRTFYDLCSGDEKELLDVLKSALEHKEKLEKFREIIIKLWNKKEYINLILDNVGEFETFSKFKDELGFDDDEDEEYCCPLNEEEFNLLKEMLK